MSKIIGVTVGTPISPKKLSEKLSPVKTVNGKSPDANGNVELDEIAGYESLTLGVHTDGLIYLFKNGEPQGVGLEIKAAEVEGGDVVGYIDENNNIVLKGNLAEDTYTVKYEMEDGTTLDIGNLVFTNSYTVTNTLTNCTNSNSATSVAKNGSYSTTISANSGYNLSSVKVTMGGTDITASAVSGGSINIANVTGNIVITASATEAAVYYTVTKNLTNCSISNAATSVLKGSSYTATISANSGYELSSTTVTMGGSPVSVSNGVINISKVTGDITITAVATEVQTSNPDNILTSGAYDIQFNKCWSASGKAYSTCNGMIAIKIPIADVNGKTVYFKGFTPNIKASGSAPIWYALGSDNTKLTQLVTPGDSEVGNIWRSENLQETNGVYSMAINSTTFSNGYASAAYLMINMAVYETTAIGSSIPDTFVMTIDKPIS